MPTTKKFWNGRRAQLLDSEVFILCNAFFVCLSRVWYGPPNNCRRCHCPSTSWQGLSVKIFYSTQGGFLFKFLTSIVIPTVTRTASRGKVAGQPLHCPCYIIKKQHRQVPQTELMLCLECLVDAHIHLCMSPVLTWALLRLAYKPPAPSRHKNTNQQKTP